MKAISVTAARKDFYKLIQENEEPLLIQTKSGRNAYLVSQEDWESMEETLFLLRDPEMQNDLKEAKREGHETFSSEDLGLRL